MVHQSKYIRLETMITCHGAPIHDTYHWKQWLHIMVHQSIYVILKTLITCHGASIQICNIEKHDYLLWCTNPWYFSLKRMITCHGSPWHPLSIKRETFSQLTCTVGEPLYLGASLQPIMYTEGVEVARSIACACACSGERGGIENQEGVIWRW